MHLDDLSGIMSLFEVLPSEFLHELEESGLGLASNKDDLARLGINILESRRVDCDSLVE